MGREIKFRAWQSSKKTMHQEIGLHPHIMSNHTMFDEDECGYVAEGTGKGEHTLLTNQSQWPIMQFTGIKDKNGNEIYEGDIFEDIFVSSNRGVVTYGEYTHCFDDKRLSDFGAHVGFYVKFNVTQPRKDLKYWAKNKEVIGNIHENPELLKEVNP